MHVTPYSSHITTHTAHLHLFFLSVVFLILLFLLNCSEKVEGKKTDEHVFVWSECAHHGT